MLLGKTIFINASHPSATGAAVISDRNFKLISESSVEIYRFPIQITLSAFSHNITDIVLSANLVKKQDIMTIIRFIKDKKLDCVFLDNSLFGNLAKEIKTDIPEVNIISFFHNVEYSYFRELIKVSKKFHHWFTILLVKKAEKQIVKYSNFLVALNDRDSLDIKRKYGKAVDIVLPTTFSDNYNELQDKNARSNQDILHILFVGSYFPPNIFGINWFTKNVMPHIKRKVKLLVIGSGFEGHKVLNMQGNIEMIGKVDDLANYYYQSDLVIAPIFHGSGMKTKIAEALMFNRPIFGTQEAFEGYDVDITHIGKLCNNQYDFIQNIENFQTSKYKTIRQIYLNNYSYATISHKFKDFLDAKFN
ncbi:glycosyltransferase [Pedobacter agri]|uniref:glycosyltransferase n=1 Tax=Pedobacter agri TaxID=454586 RepID=UPI002930DA36|nr:glycosyltransferase [Pedobacter agri]